MPPRAKSTKATKAAAAAASATADAAFADIAPPKTPRAKSSSTSTRKTSGTASKTDTTVKRTRKPRAKKEMAVVPKEEEGDDVDAAAAAAISQEPSLEQAEKPDKPVVKRKRATTKKKATADAAFAKIKQEEKEDELLDTASSQEPQETQDEPQEPDYSGRALLVKTEDEEQAEQPSASSWASSSFFSSSPSSSSPTHSSSRLPLPGAFAPGVDTYHAMRVVVVAAIVSSALSMVARAAVDELANAPALARYLPAWGPAWASYLSIMELPGVWSPVAALVIRLCKLALAWGSFSHLVSLDVLSYGPIVYLLASFYNVPLPAAVVSVAIDLVADVAPLALWQWYAGGAPAVATKEEEQGGDFSEDVSSEQDPPYLNDPASFTYSATFAGVLYAFVFVQACRFFLPSTFVVHYLGIATVEPARPVPLSSTAPTTLYEVFVSVFLSYAALSLNFVGGVAARTFIFAGSGGAGSSNGSSSYGYKTAVAIRSVSLAVVVGVNVFLQVFLGIQGVDAIGAAAYASIWAAAPLLVGAGLALIGA